MEGSIQKFGSQLRAHVQVWNAEDGATLLSIKHDAETADLFGLQDRIAETVYATLGIAAALWIGGLGAAAGLAWLRSDLVAAGLAVLASIATALLTARGTAQGRESPEAVPISRNRA